MDPKTGRLKNNLSDAQDTSYPGSVNREDSQGDNSHLGGSKIGKWLVLIGIIFLFLYASGGFNVLTVNPLTVVKEGMENINQPSEDLLNRMGARMVEMGYGEFSHEELINLRRDGLTATYISNIRALGYTGLTVEDAVRLVKANASSTFIAMMIELQYHLEIEDILRLRNAGVTANFTSRIHDLGYRDVTVDQLVRMRRIGVTVSNVRNLQEQRGEDITLEEIIRYRISNQ